MRNGDSMAHEQWEGEIGDGEMSMSLVWLPRWMAMVRLS